MRGRYTAFFTHGLPLFGQQGAGLGLLQIPPTDLGQVENIKGNASALYGSSAIAGVVNLISRRPVKEPIRDFLFNRSSLGAKDGSMFLGSQLTPHWGATLLVAECFGPVSLWTTRTAAMLSSQLESPMRTVRRHDFRRCPARDRQSYTEALKSARYDPGGICRGFSEAERGSGDEDGTGTRKSGQAASVHSEDAPAPHHRVAERRIRSLTFCRHSGLQRSIDRFRCGRCDRTALSLHCSPYRDYSFHAEEGISWLPTSMYSQACFPATA